MGLTRITSDGITDATIATADLADQSVTLAKLPHGTSSNDGKFLRANNGADPTFETVNTDLVSDTSPQLGGALDTNNQNIEFGDVGNASQNRLTFGAGGDLKIFHNASDSKNFISTIGNNDCVITSRRVDIKNDTNDETMASFIKNGAVELYHDNSKKFETTSAGGTLTGDFTVTGNIYGGNHITIQDSDGSSDMLKIGASEDIRIYHYNNNSYIRQHTDLPLIIGGTSTGQSLYLQPKDGENSAIFKPNGAVELYYDNIKQLKTHTDAIYIQTNADQGRIRLADTSGNIAYQITGQDVASSGESGGRLVIQDANGGIFLDARTSGGNCFVYNSLLLTGNGSLDNLKLALGASSDLQLYHNGTDSKISNSTGDLVIMADSFKLRNAAESEKLLDATANGAVELYHDNSKKFETVSYGTLTTGESRADNFQVLDYQNTSTGVIKVGSGDDLRIYHYNNNTYIENNTNNLHIGAFSVGSNSGIAFYSNNTIQMYLNPDGHLVPDANNNHDLGSSSLRWRNVYTNDLNLSNEGGSNDVDGTWGSYTIQEGEESLFLINKRNGKKYKFNLTEVS